MAEPPELWVFLLTNVSLFVVSSLLTGLCYLAYRRRGGQRSFALATIGFGFVVLGGLVEPVYQLGIGVDFTLTGTELMLLEGTETGLIAVGLALLFYAITRHRSGSSPAGDDHTSLTGDDGWWSEHRPGD